MTREEAIRILSTRDAHGVLCGYTSGVTEAIDMAIEALSADAPSGDLISRQDAIDAINVSWGLFDARKRVEAIPSAEAVEGWNNHEVACMLAELFGDACACNYNDIDEWLPLVCDLEDICPNTVGVACWEQFLTHYGERREP